MEMQNDTHLAHIKCYELPYGSVGTVSHILTIYTAVCLFFDRTPWFPWRENKHYTLDKLLSAAGIAGTAATTIFVMVRCRAEWQYVLRALWKMVWSCSFALISATSARHVHAKQRAESPQKQQRNYYEDPHKPARYELKLVSAYQDRWEDVRMPSSYTVVNRDRTQSNMDLGKPVLERYRPFLVMGLVSSVIGMSGLFSLALKEWDRFGVRYLVLAFAAIGVVCLVVFPVGRLVVNYWDDRSLGRNPRRSRRSRTASQVCQDFFLGVFVNSTLALLFSDWILAVISGNYVGAPDGNNAALTWIYFVAKRLPFFSM